jgi:hypothetical protein
MDESLHDLENELKALRPRRPSVLLRARVEHELAADAAATAAASAPASAERAAAPALPARRYTTATTLRSWKWVSWPMAAAAAIALTVSLGVWRYQTRSAAEPTTPRRDFAAPTKDAGATSAPETPRAAPTTDRMFAAASPRDAYRPVKAANVLYDLQDEGPVLLEDNTPARRVRARYVDTYTWKNPATNASLKWSVPRDEVRVLPASFH